MDRNFARSLSLVLKHEGGWSDHLKDPGGATMKGVTLANFRRYVKADATKDDLRKISDEQIATVYRRFYWDAVAGAELPDGIDFAVFDFGVNSGPSRSIKFLQKIVGVKQDGKLGPASIAALKAMPAATIINRLCDDRLAFLKRLKTWPTFGKGWGSRVSDVRSQALKMAAQPTPEKPTVIKKTVEVEKPVVPPAVESSVKKKFSLFGWISGLFSTGGLGALGIAGMDWQAIVAIAGVILVVAVLGLLLRHQIIGAVKEIRSGLES